MEVDKTYAFDGPKGKASLLDLFEGRRQLIVYRAFFEPGVFGWPDHACRGCSLGADQVAHLAHLNARDTTLVYASRAPQADIARLKARMGWKMPWYTITDSFDADFGVDEWHGHNVFIRDGERIFRTYFDQQPRRRGDRDGTGAISTSRRSAARRLGRIRRRAIPQTPAVQVVELARQLRAPRRHPTEMGRGVRRGNRRLQRAERSGKSLHLRMSQGAKDELVMNDEVGVPAIVRPEHLPGRVPTGTEPRE